MGYSCQPYYRASKVGFTSPTATATQTSRTGRRGGLRSAAVTRRPTKCRAIHGVLAVPLLVLVLLLLCLSSNNHGDGVQEEKRIGIAAVVVVAAFSPLSSRTNRVDLPISSVRQQRSSRRCTFFHSSQIIKNEVLPNDINTIIPVRHYRVCNPTLLSTNPTIELDDDQDVDVENIIEDSEDDLEEEEEDGTTSARDDDDDGDDGADDSNTNKGFRKSKWKKKRFWMMQDVMKRIEGNDDSAPRKAEEMIHRMYLVYDKTNRQHEECLPNLEVYNLWIHALAKFGKGREAEAVLRTMQQQKQPSPSPSGNSDHDDAFRYPIPRPNVVSYTSVMDAYANQPTSDAASEAERLLWELIEYSERHPYNSESISSVVSDTVLNAWAKQGTWEGATRAEEILHRLESYADDNILSSTTSSKSSSSSVSIHPTEHSYASVIHAWASCRGGRPAALKAQEVLDRMIERAGTAAAHKSKSKSSKNAVNIVVEPDTVIFNAVINAWANSGDPQAGSKALQLLNQMQQLHVQKGYDTRPDTVSYNTVLSAWSHSGHINAATQAERVLNEMLLAHRQAPDVAPAPCTTSYNNVLHAWSQSPNENASARAEAVLNYMLQVCNQEPNITPDVYSFTSVLNAIAKSKVPDKAARARDWLDRMCDVYFDNDSETADGDEDDESKRQQRRLPFAQQQQRPTQVPFNTVLNACAFSAMGTTEEQQRQALQIAVQTFKRMKQDYNIAPDTVSFGNMLKCAANLMPPGKIRTDMAMQLFEKCCDDGLVGEMVWNEVRRAVPPKILQDRLRRLATVLNSKPIGTIRIRDLPRGWTRNVRDKRSAYAAAERRSQQQRKKQEANQKRQRNRSATGPVQRLRNISEPSYQSGRDL